LASCSSLPSRLCKAMCSGRAASVPSIRRRISRKKLAGLGIVLWALFLLGRVFGREDAGAITTTLEIFGMTWMAMLFLTSVALFAVEVATGFGFFLARFGPGLRGAALAAGCALSAVALFQGLRAPVVQNYDVYLNGLPGELDGTVIVALSDLHLGSVLGERWLTARVEQVRRSGLTSSYCSAMYRRARRPRKGTARGLAALVGTARHLGGSWQP